ncbi:hypothetical protein EB809_11335 [Marinobacter sp. R17]|uniref:DUF6160 family protein n=1 Tax=Marinobacter sp. R17 TaxID=2484250 RepID=UPI000F4B8095|nr:DUF6160 family protein [Marinobacter sp. R17]ROT99228.1 hypothetical protein EB809_11335 [Marinobacter sp. R17]
MNRDALKRVAPVCFGLMLSSVVQAELKPISDSEMEQVTGQAMMAVDIDGTPEHRYTRVTMGLDAEIQTNIDTVALGDTGDGSDVLVSQLSLGHISTDATQVQLNGQTYAVNEIVPFEASNPYFELAEENGDIVGFRMGFGQARGTLSGDFESFSGNLGIKLEDSSGNVSDAQLYDASGNATNTRASYIGLNDAATDCTAGVQCAPLTNLKTLDIGADNGDGTVSPTEDFFISFQKAPVSWASNATGGTAVDAAAGVYLNIPTSMQMDLTTLQNGISRARTEYIDRGVGLF